MVCVWEGAGVCHRLTAWKHPDSHPARWAHGERPNLGPRDRVKSITVGLLASGGHRIQTCSGCLARPVWSRAPPAAQKADGDALRRLQLTHAAQTRACCTLGKYKTQSRADPNLDARERREHAHVFPTRCHFRPRPFCRVRGRSQRKTRGVAVTLSSLGLKGKGSVSEPSRNLLEPFHPQLPLLRSLLAPNSIPAFRGSGGRD